MSSYFPQVGDFVMIRPWDDMVKEFGTDSYGDIPTLPMFFLRFPFLLSYLCSCRLFFLLAVHPHFLHLF